MTFQDLSVQPYLDTKVHNHGNGSTLADTAGGLYRSYTQDRPGNVWTRGLPNDVDTADIVLDLGPCTEQSM